MGKEDISWYMMNDWRLIEEEKIADIENREYLEEQDEEQKNLTHIELLKEKFANNSEAFDFILRYHRSALCINGLEANANLIYLNCTGSRENVNYEFRYFTDINKSRVLSIPLSDLKNSLLVCKGVSPKSAIDYIQEKGTIGVNGLTSAIEEKLVIRLGDIETKDYESYFGSGSYFSFKIMGFVYLENILSNAVSKPLLYKAKCYEGHNRHSEKDYQFLKAYETKVIPRFIGKDFMLVKIPILWVSEV